MSKEALRLALEALEICSVRQEHQWQGLQKMQMAEHALREALAEQPAQQQEPVAFLVDGDLYYPEEIDWETLQDQGHTVTPLYTSPPASKPLTDEEIADLWSAQIFHINDLKLAKDFVRDIEAAHGIKGNA